MDLIKNKFEIIVVGVFAYPFDKRWLGRKIDKKFISDVKKLNEKFGISLAGEGGEFESFVLNCPLFSRRLEIKSFRDFGSGNSWRRKIKNREMFCLVDKEEILGVIDLKDDKIGSLFVRYDSVGKSYGKKLLNFIEHYAKKRGIKKVWLYSTPYAEEFYLNKG